jgi:hypothetical protein
MPDFPYLATSRGCSTVLLLCRWIAVPLLNHARHTTTSTTMSTMTLSMHGAIHIRHHLYTIVLYIYYVWKGKATPGDCLNCEANAMSNKSLSYYMNSVCYTPPTTPPVQGALHARRHLWMQVGRCLEDTCPRCSIPAGYDLLLSLAEACFHQISFTS